MKCKWLYSPLLFFVLHSVDFSLITVRYGRYITANSQTFFFHPSLADIQSLCLSKPDMRPYYVCLTNQSPMENLHHVSLIAIIMF